MNEATNNSNKQNKKNEVGALWKKVSTSGSEYFSGYVSGENGEKIKVVAFENTYKKPGETTPDFRIFISEARQTEGSASPVADRRESQSPKKNKTIENSVVEEVSGDDIPF